MPYRGDDLDLRTPQGWSASRDAGRDSLARDGSARDSSARDGGGREGRDEPGWWTRSAVYKGGRGDPIWVDDNVLACCNHAYDLAVAHRAPEVRLEHLLNAMTLNEAIGPVLEARGIGVAQLRRESGSILANDIPAAPANGKGQPTRSEALVETLRLAADHAYARRAPVTVDDILHVLFDMNRDLPGLALLRRHAATWTGRSAATERPDLRLEPLPHLTRPAYVAPPFEDPRPRYTPAPAPVATTEFAAARPSRERDRDRDAVTPPSTIDTLQNNRLDALDRAVRDLGLDLADDRKSLQSIVGDLQRHAQTQSDDTSRFRGGLTERLNSLEDVLHRTRGEPATLPVALLDRIAGIERMVDLRLTEMSRSQPSAAVLADRLAAIERSLEARLADMARNQPSSTAVTDRLAAIERTLDQRIAEIGRGWASVGERLQALELQVKRPVDAAISPLLTARLDAMAGVDAKIDGLERSIGLILDHMTGLERQIGGVEQSVAQQKPVDLSPVQARLGDLERNVVARVAQSVDIAPVTDLLSGVESKVSGIEATVGGLERTLDNRTAETGRTVSFIGERLRAFDETIGSHKSDMTERLGQIERSLSAYAERTVEAGTAHEQDLIELHEALVKLNANQQALSGSLDQWRLDNTGDLSVVSNRLKSIEETTQRRDQLVDTLVNQVSAIHSVVAKREAHKSRFRNWLFGTDEWISASYDTEHWRARQAVDILRGLDARPQPVPRQTPAPPAPAALRRT